MVLPTQGILLVSGYIEAKTECHLVLSCSWGGAGKVFRILLGSQEATSFDSSALDDSYQKSFENVYIMYT